MHGVNVSFCQAHMKYITYPVVDITNRITYENIAIIF